MSFIKNLAVTSLKGPNPRHPIAFHQQDRRENLRVLESYCGAAAAQMVLDSIGVGLLDQTDLYSATRNRGNDDPERNWYSTPDGLHQTMEEIRKKEKPAGFPS